MFLIKIKFCLEFEVVDFLLLFEVATFKTFLLFLSMPVSSVMGDNTYQAKQFLYRKLGSKSTYLMKNTGYITNFLRFFSDAPSSDFDRTPNIPVFARVP